VIETRQENEEEEETWRSEVERKSAGAKGGRRSEGTRKKEEAGNGRLAVEGR